MDENQIYGCGTLLFTLLSTCDPRKSVESRFFLALTGGLHKERPKRTCAACLCRFMNPGKS